MRTPLALMSAAVLALGALTGCAADDESTDRLEIVTSAYPFQWISERVAGDRATVTNLVKPGAEPHDIELTAVQTALVSDASLVVYLPTFQPAVDDAVAQYAAGHTFDITSVQPLAAADDADHPGKDPHVWLDPLRLAAIADQLAERLADIDAPHAAEYTDRAAAVRTELAALDEAYTTGLRTCERREIVTAHEAFGYIAARYDLRQIGISGLSPDDEPSAQRIAEIIDEAKTHGATVIFTERLVSPAVAQSIAAGAGAKTEVLDPIESLPAGSTADYAKIMRTNLDQLRVALGCS